MTIGERIRELRTRLGWEQADLAQRLSKPVEQQTVSRWERGGSRPRREVVIELARIFEVDTTELLDAAGYLEASDGSVQQPVHPRLTILPVWELAPDKFEELVTDIAQQLRPDTFVTRFGAQGHKQYGVDVVAEKDGRYELTYQCKRREEFGPQDVSEAVAQVTIDAPAHYLVLSRRSASPEARQEMQRHVGWTLWDAQDISRIIRGLPLERSVRIVDTYFPGGWRESFLGVAEPGPWLLAEEFFLPVVAGSLYSHEWTLVGRNEELNALRGFVADSSQRIGILEGRGGLGKTKLLHELALSDPKPSVAVRFVRTGSELRPEHYELLPASEPMLIIVDDVHERDDIVALIGDTVRRNPLSKFLLALRPYAFELLAADLQRLGLSLDNAARITLSDLPFGDAEKLAAEALGEGWPRQLAVRLGTLTADCPFITVIAGVLIDRGVLKPDCVDHEETIKKHVLRTFRDVMVDAGSSGDSELRRGILEGIAVLQPFRSGDPDFQSSLSTLIDQPYDRAVRHIRSFEDAGIVLRRSDSLRIVPDLLGDIVLSSASFDEGARVPTGYLERVLRACKGEATRNLFVNAARVGWQIHHDDPDAPQLTDSLWDEADSAATGAGILGRISLLALLEKVAYFEPERSLKLVRWVMNNPTDRVEDVDDALAGLYKYTYQDVLNAVPAVLRAVAYNMQHLREAGNLLWELAATDRRATNPHPDHPLRVLQSLAELAPGKPFAFNAMMIELAADWLSHEVPQGGPSPFDVLEPILATEGSEHMSDGFSVQFRSYRLSPSDVEPLRARVLKLAFDELSSTDIARAVRAVSVIEASVRPPIGFGHEVPDEVRKSWTPGFVRTLEMLKETLANNAVDPVIDVAVRRALRWRLDDDDAEMREATRSIIDGLPTSLENRLAISLFDGWGELVASRDTDIQEMDQLKETQADEVVAELLSQTDDEIVDLLEARLTAQRTAFNGKSGAPGYFAWRLVAARVDIGKAMCRRVSLDPDSVFVDVAAVVLACLAEQLGTDAIAMAGAMLARDSLTLRRVVAQAFGWNRGGRSSLLDGELEMLLGLAANEDVYTRQCIVMASRRLAENHRAEALMLVCHIPFRDEPKVADEVFQLFSGMGSFEWNELPEADSDSLLEQLKSCPSVEGYWVEGFLSKLSEREPTVVVELFKTRIDIWEDVESVLQYHPIPLIWRLPLRVLSRPLLVPVLRDLRTWLADRPESWKRQDAGGRLFAAVAGDFQHPDVIDFMEQTVAEARTSSAIQALASILRQMPREVFLGNGKFAARVLDAASKVSDEAVGEVGAAMHGAVVSGSYTGRPGQPYPRDVEQRDQARLLAGEFGQGSLAERFYRDLESSAEQRIRWQADRHEKLLDNREW